MGVGAATLELEEEEEELEPLVLGGTEELEGRGVLVLLGMVLVLVEEGGGLDVVVGVGSSPPKFQVPCMTPWASVPPKKWKRPGLKSKSPGPQLTHCSNRQ